MLDFLRIATRHLKSGVVEIYPKFVINNRTQDLMVRGGDFCAVWDERAGLWSTDEQDVTDQVDAILAEEAMKYKDSATPVHVLYMWDADSGSIDRWHKFVKQQMRDRWHQLDSTFIFANAEVRKEDYATKRLPYALPDGPQDIPNYKKLFTVLYEPEQLQKLEWVIGAILTGASKSLQKFLVLYGSGGTGKSTWIDMVEQLTKGYSTKVDVKGLASGSDFGLEDFKSNPLVAFQHEANLSRIEDNSKLNSIVSHDEQVINEKFKNKYVAKFHTFLILGTNYTVRITDAKSGLIRRLLDVNPSGNKVPRKVYDKCVAGLKFELGGIAYHCIEVFNKLGATYYDDYIPTTMIADTNDFYDFVEDNYDDFAERDYVTKVEAWKKYKAYCEFASVPYPLSMRKMQAELKNYFLYFEEESRVEGRHVRGLYSGFIKSKFKKGQEKDDGSVDGNKDVPADPVPVVASVGLPDGVKDKDPYADIPQWLQLKEQHSLFDDIAKDYPAQVAYDDGTTCRPQVSWDKCTTTLKDISTNCLHFVRVPVRHIVIDFDIKGTDGSKDLLANLLAASRWPETYAEVSKSGSGVHLHYIWDGGNPEQLSRVAENNVEVKVFTGNSSLRRKLTKCNDIPIRSLVSGLNRKEEKLLDNFVLANQAQIVSIIKNALQKKYEPHSTRCSIDHIYNTLEAAYNNPTIRYDVTRFRPAIAAFAAKSTHQSNYCRKMVEKMHWCSDILPDTIPEPEENPIVFYDIECLKNFFLISYKLPGTDDCIDLINPTADEVQKFMQSTRRIGFNSRKYDEHMLVGRTYGYSNKQSYQQSRAITSNKDADTTGFFLEGYHSGYADIYDLASKKQSLKKWEIEMGVPHQELPLRWDQEVPEDMIPTVIEYCHNDVKATEALWNWPSIRQDFVAREVLVDLVHDRLGMESASVFDTTRILATKFIFGNEKHPQLIYTDLKTGEQFGTDDPMPREYNSWPEYDIVDDRNMYKGEDLGYGGYVYAEPGTYYQVALLDIESLHPHSIKALKALGEEGTERFVKILDTRLAIKHHDLEKAISLMPEMSKYLATEEQADNLAQALKIVINSVYGYTSASFDNPFHDERNTNNIVALRGALFMCMLKREVQAMGYKVAHIKTDSIKIPNASADIIEYCQKRAKEFGYTFEHEATYAKMCLVNDAVYIAKYATTEWCERNHGYIPGKNAKAKKKGMLWTATGTQFQVPYVFKTLFSHEPIEFNDLRETKEVKTALYLDMNEGLPDVTAVEKELDKLEKSWKKTGFVDIKRVEELKEEKAKGHEMIFVGRVGSFCPIKPGCGGGLLMREAGEGKYAFATGAKDYRWLESTMVKERHKEDDIDLSYYAKLVDDAIDNMKKFCKDVDGFINDDTEHDLLPGFMVIPAVEEDEVPFDEDVIAA